MNKGRNPAAPSQPSYKQPTVTLTAEGRPRTVGFELEFTGLDLPQTIALVEEVFGGRRHAESVAAASVSVTGLGDFRVELDWHFLKKKAALDTRGEEQWLDLLSQAATLLVPVEVICPPLAMSDLQRLDPLTEALRRSGARGTEDSWIAAYGVHINTRIPCLDAPSLFAYMRAFGLLQWWLVDAHQVDLARRISPYVDLYPEAYLKRLFTLREPDLGQLLRDYLQYNASRNRALDLLPLLAEIDAAAVSSAVADSKISPRPAFHYRLPNCQIDRPGWSLADSWNTWWIVEELAHRLADLDELATCFLAMDRPLLGVSRSAWTAFVDRWLHDHALA